MKIAVSIFAVFLLATSTVAQESSAAAPVQPQKFATYSGVSLKRERALLDSFAAKWKQDDTVELYIFGYGGRHSLADEAPALIDRAKTYLVDKQGVSTLMITAIDGGSREKPTVELWLVPNGATPPTASPTVDPSELLPPKPVVKGKRRP